MDEDKQRREREGKERKGEERQKDRQIKGGRKQKNRYIFLAVNQNRLCLCTTLIEVTVHKKSLDKNNMEQNLVCRCKMQIKGN
jgi:hypothetical protein